MEKVNKYKRYYGVLEPLYIKGYMKKSK